MTNAPEGRTYITDKHYELCFNHMTDRWDSRPVVETHVVPNGKWVMERPHGWAWLVGVEFDELEELQFLDKHDMPRTLYVSDKPFGYVTADEQDVEQSVVKPHGRKRLHYARQIRKGELGRGVPTPPLDYVRQPLEDGQKPSVTKARERRRGNHGWVKMADLGEMSVGYNPDKVIELVLGYWQFSGHLHYENHQRVGTLVDTVWGSSLDIQLGEIEVESMTREQFTREARLDTSEMWVRRGFAFTILRLLALGVKPEVMQTV